MTSTVNFYLRITSTQILVAFLLLYTHVHAQPCSIPARSDLSLLLSTAKTVRAVVRNTPFGRSTADLVEHMFHLVSSRVDQAARLLNINDAAASSSSSAWDDTEVAAMAQAQVPDLPSMSDNLTMNSDLSNPVTSNFGTVFGLEFNFFSEPPAEVYAQDPVLPL
jgi:hypothetical protein